MRRRFALGARAALTAWLVALTMVAGADAQTAPGPPAPELAAGQWINSAPLSIEGLRGRVVLVEFWTFG
jgi:hypothetical protein